MGKASNPSDEVPHSSLHLSGQLSPKTSHMTALNFDLTNIDLSSEQELQYDLLSEPVDRTETGMNPEANKHVFNN